MSREQTKAAKLVEDASVNVTEIVRSNDVKVVSKVDPDETEYSSSFAETSSGRENCSGMSDNEVDSKIEEESGFASPFDGLSSLFPVRKRKLTSHWRNYIRPIMWRCKWAELRMREFEFLASKYDSMIASNQQKKHGPIDQTEQEVVCSRSRQFVRKNYRTKAMKRRKKKRAEETIDSVLDLSNHNLFSYYENRGSGLDGASAGDDTANTVPSDTNETGADDFGFDDEWTSPENNGGSPDQLLRNIETMRTRILGMKEELALVRTKNAIRFSSSESLSHLMSCGEQSSCAQSPLSACDGDAMSPDGLGAPNHEMDYDMGDFIIHGNAISGFGEAVLVPDIIESTVGLLSSADVTPHGVQIGDSSEKIMDNILINNEAAEAESNRFQNNHNLSTEGQDLDNTGDNESSNPTLPVSESNGVARTATSREPSALASCLAADIHFPTKRKRGERKPCSWGRQKLDEPDSQ